MHGRKFCSIFGFKGIPARFLSTVPLTSERYSVTREAFSKLRQEDVSYFRTFLGDHQVIKDAQELEAYNTDWLHMVRGNSQLLLKPRTTEDVSRILRHCNERNLAVCPQGGNTGLVGGSVPVFDEIILSTQLMNKVIEFNDLTGALVCQAGCVLQTLDQYVAEYGYIMPLDLGASGSCHIGGNISTNAGGIRLIRYGNLHGNLLGVEAVLSNGDIFDGLSTIRKDNTGYDLGHLFVGSEGTLGIVTGVALQTASRPQATNVAFLAAETFDSCLAILRAAKTELGEVMSSCEFLDHESMRCVTENLSLTPPIGENPFYMLIETSGSNASHDQEKLDTFLENIMVKGDASDGTMADSPSTQQKLWGFRERMAEALLKDGYNYKYDISLPIESFYKAVEVMRENLTGMDEYVRCCGYGHIGDGNLHLNITSRGFTPILLNAIEPFVYDWTKSQKGSVSAEHGLGFKKKDFIYHSKSVQAVKMMKQIKSILDPKGILNPYKVLPSF